jgi:predicted metal-dependent hydrolase
VLLFKIIFRRRIVRRRKGSRVNYLKYKEQARALVHERINHFNDFYNFKFNQVSIKNTKSRWGSCSKKGNLNFNYKIVLLPPKLADYLVVHEMCHLEQFDHSEKFWKLVSIAIPEYKERRKELKRVVL